MNFCGLIFYILLFFNDKKGVQGFPMGVQIFLSVATLKLSNIEYFSGFPLILLFFNGKKGVQAYLSVATLEFNNFDFL